MATILAAASGNWTSGSTWAGGVVPTTGDTAVLNGYTVNMVNGDNITCSKITSLGASYGGVDGGSIRPTLANGMNWVGIITANMEGGSGAMSTFYYNAGNCSSITLTVNGNITSITTTTNVYGVLQFTCSSTTLTLNITVNGNIYSGVHVNSYGINITGTSNTSNVTINGSCYCPSGYNGYCLYDSGAVGNWNISGSVDANAYTGYINATVKITPTYGGSLIISNGLVSQSTNSGYAVESGVSTTINANTTTGRCLDCYGGCLSILDNNSNAAHNVTLNGNIITGYSINGYSISMGLSSKLRTVTINGNVTAGSAYTSQTPFLNYSSKAIFTINGNVDATNFARNNANYIRLAPSSSYNTADFIVNGDVMSQTNSGVGYSCIYLAGSPAQYYMNLTFNGWLYAGNNGPCVDLGGQTVQSIYLKNIRGNNYGVSSSVLYPAITNGFVGDSCTIDGIVDMQYGNGNIPITKIPKLKFTTNAAIKYTDSNSTTQTAYLSALNVVIPNTSNVRSGVAVGNGVGTMVMPPPAAVLSGYVYDNNSVGLLGNYTSRFDSIDAALSGTDFSGFSVDPDWQYAILHVNVNKSTGLITQDGKYVLTNNGVVVDNTNLYNGNPTMSFGTSGTNNFSYGITGSSIMQGNFTISTVIRMSAIPTALQMLFCAYNNCFNVELTTSGTIGLWIYNTGGASSSYTTSPPLSINTWYKLVFIRNGLNYKILLNDTVVIDVDGTTTNMSFSWLFVGKAGWDNTLCFKGNMYDVVVFDGVAKSINDVKVSSLVYPLTTPATVSGTLSLASRVANVLYKTNQLAFSNGKVLADTGGGNNDYTTQLNAMQTVLNKFVFTGNDVNAHVSSGTVSVDLSAINTTLTSISNVVDNTAIDVTDIKTTTDQFTFTGSNVNSVASGLVDYSPQLTTISTAVNSANSAISAVKTKTDQLTFGVYGVNATSTSSDWTARFNALDDAIANIPAITYTGRFNYLDSKLDALVLGGGVDFTQVLTAIDNNHDLLVDVNTTANLINAKTNQMTFGQYGINADVAVSVNNVIDYSSRLDALESLTGQIKGKTDQLLFTQYGVKADASVDNAAIIDSVGTSLSSILTTQLTSLHTQLATHDTDVKQMITTIQNVTGSADLTPIISSLSTLHQSVSLIPTINYTSRFNALDGMSTTTLDNVLSITAETTNSAASFQQIKNLIIAS